MPDDLRWNWCNKVHSNCKVLELSENHHPPLVHGKIVFHKTHPWCQKGWGPLIYTMFLDFHMDALIYDTCIFSFWLHSVWHSLDSSASLQMTQVCSFLWLLACMLSHFSHVWLCVTLWTIACQAPLSMGFSRQEYWSGLPFPPPFYGVIFNWVIFNYVYVSHLFNPCLW